MKWSSLNRRAKLCSLFSTYNKFFIRKDKKSACIEEMFKIENKNN